MRRTWLAWLALDAMLSACAGPTHHTEPPPPARRPLHDATANRTERIANQLAWAFGEQPAQPGPLLEGYVPGGAVAGIADLEARLTKPRADGRADLQLAIIPTGDRISAMTLDANDATACAAVTKRAEEKWPTFVSFVAERPWLVWSQEDGTRAAWSSTASGCELRFEPWQPTVADWFEQPGGVVELALLDIVAARERLGTRVTGAELTWTNPGLGVGVGATTCTAVDERGTVIRCRGASDAKTQDALIAWLDDAFGPHATPTSQVAASTQSAAFGVADGADSRLAWTPPGPSLVVKLERRATSWTLEIRHVAPADDARRATACARAAASYDDGYGQTSKQRAAIVKDLCTSTPWPSATLQCIRAKKSNVEKCIAQMIPPLQHVLETKLFTTR